MNQPNSFQNRCIAELIGKLRVIGVEEPHFNVEQEIEWYQGSGVLMEAIVADLRIWVYTDGAHIRRPNVNIPFEALDYDTEDDLIAVFTDKVVDLLTKKN